MKKIIFVCCFLFWYALLFSASPTLYVVTRNGGTYKHPPYQHPTAGLFLTTDLGKNRTHLGWPYGKFFSVATTETDNARVFFMACGNGVLKSANSGADWVITTGWDITEVLKCAIHPQEPNTVLAATAYGIVKTTDGGKTWEKRNDGLASSFTSTVFYDRQNPDVCFTATENGVHISKDGGELWQPIALLGYGIRTVIQHPKNPNLLAAGTEDDGVFISTDKGQTWQQKIRGLDVLTVYALAFNPEDENMLYAGTYLGGVYQTLDQGQNWKPVNNGLGNLAIHALVVDPSKTRRIFAGTLGDGLWKSENSGRSWEFIGLPTSEVWDMTFD